MLPPPAWRIAGPRPAAIPDALDVDRHRRVPLGLVDRVKAAAVQGAVKRGIVDQRVDPAKGAHPGLDPRLSRARVGDVELYADRLRTDVLHHVERFGAVVDVAGDDAGPGRCEAPGELLPKTACRTGDRDDLVLHIEHRSAPAEKHKPPLGAAAWPRFGDLS
jgi:hypothetical protein